MGERKGEWRKRHRCLNCKKVRYNYSDGTCYHCGATKSEPVVARWVDTSPWWGPPLWVHKGFYEVKEDWKVKEDEEKSWKEPMKSNSCEGGLLEQLPQPIPQEGDDPMWDLAMKVRDTAKYIDWKVGEYGAHRESYFFREPAAYSKITVRRWLTHGKASYSIILEYEEGGKGFDKKREIPESVGDFIFQMAHNKTSTLSHLVNCINTNLDNLISQSKGL